MPKSWSTQDLNYYTLNLIDLSGWLENFANIFETIMGVVQYLAKRWCKNVGLKISVHTLV